MLNDGDDSSPVEEDLSLAIKANFIKDLSENVTTLNVITMIFSKSKAFKWYSC